MLDAKYKKNKKKCTSKVNNKHTKTLGQCHVNGRKMIVFQEYFSVYYVQFCYTICYYSIKWQVKKYCDTTNLKTFNALYKPFQ